MPLLRTLLWISGFIIAHVKGTYNCKKFVEVVLSLCLTYFVCKNSWITLKSMSSNETSNSTIKNLTYFSINVMN